MRAATSMFLISLAKSLLALGVDDGLLVLGRRPLGVAAHDAPCSLLTACRPGPSPRTARAPGVAGQLRVERRRQQRALPYGDDPTGGRPLSTRRQHLDTRPTCSTHGARMKTACTGPRRCPRSRRPSRTSPPAGRTRCAARSCRCRRASPGPRAVQHPVGQQDHPRTGPVGRQAGPHRLAQRFEEPKTRASLPIVVDSPPGITMPSDRRAPRGGGPPGRRRGPQGPEVLAHVALEGEDPHNRVDGTAGHDRQAYGPGLGSRAMDSSRSR